MMSLPLPFTRIAAISVNRWLLAVALWIGAGVALANIQVQLQPNPALPGEMVDLTITQSPAGQGEPRLQPLPDGVRELQRQSTQSTQFINGQRRTSRSWIITLVGTRPGEFDIAFEPLDGTTIAPQILQVATPPPGAAQAPEVFAQFEASTREPVVQGQISLLLRVYIAGELDSGSLPDPAAPGLILEKIRERNDGEELIGNTRYRVIERQYAAFAEQAGELVIPGPVFSGNVVDRSRRSRFPSFSVPTRRVSTVAPDIRLTVRPAQPRADATWLPAAEVTLDDQLDDRTSIDVGEAFTRVVELRIAGQLHTQVPELQWPLPPRDQAQSFVEEPLRQTQTWRDGVQAVIRQNFVHLPQQAGTLELPAVRLPWFNTGTGTWEEALLPARQVEVRPAAGRFPTPTKAPSQAQDVPEPAAPSSAPADDDSADFASARAELATALNRWRALALACAAGWLVTLLGWAWLGWQQRQADAVNDPANASGMSSATRVRRTTQVARAVETSRTPQEAAAAIRDWARQSGLASSARAPGLLGLAEVVGDPALERALQALSAAMYGGAQPWQPQPLAEALRGYRPALTGGPSTPRASALPPLYPDDPA